MQAITTKYAGPTNTRNARVIATCQAGRITIEWDNNLHRDDNHAAAARALIQKLGWNDPAYGAWVQGGLGDGANVFVCAGYGPNDATMHQIKV